MAESGTTFPAFIRATFVDGPDGFPRFESEAVKMTGRIGQQIKSGLKKAGEDGGRALGEAILGAAGSLNLDTAGLRRAATAATEQATELRKVAQAAELASIELGQTNSVATAYSAATRAAAIAAEEHARALSADATAAEQLAATMARAGVNVNALGVAHGQAAAGAGSNRMAMVQVGQQVQDFAVQIASGQSVLVAFTQQASQAAFVAQGLGGAAGSVAKFFAGPWGTALLLGSTILGPLVAKMLEGAGNADQLRDATGKMADAWRTGVAAADALTEATRALDDITGRTKKSAGEAKVEALLLADSRLKQAVAARAAAAAELELARSLSEAQRARASGPGQRGELAALGLEQRQGRVDALQERLAALDKSIATARQAISAGMQPGNFASRFLEQGGYDRRIDARPEPKKPDSKDRSAADEAKKAERATRELDQALVRIRGEFDPAAAAAQRYADALAEIAKLEKAGRIGRGEAGLLTAAAGVRRLDEEARAWETQVRGTMERLGPEWTEALNQPLTDGILSASELLEREFGKAADATGRRLAAGVVDAADVFGRLLGPRGAGFAEAFGRVQQTTPNTALRQLGTAIFGAEQTKAIGKAIGIAVRGAELGGEAGSLVLGRGGSRLGSELGGALGSTLGKPGGPLAKGLESVFKGLGDFAGPLGSIAGGLLGGLIGGALKTVPRASATIGGSGGSLQVAAVTGTSKALRDQATSSADSAIATLQQIADQFGVGIDASRGSVSIGSRNGKFRVDTSGRGITKTKKGAIDFGEDGSAAIQAATLDLIRDGVLVGLRRGSQALLQNAKDLQVGLQKALKFESVFTRLKEIEDPAGAALDAVDKEFSNLRRTFEEAGASAAEYAQLEKLYGLQRVDAIKQAGQAMTATLKDLVDELTTGDNGLSLRDRLSAALASYDPLRDQLRAGTLKDFDAYAQAARTVLDIERQLGGSQDSYFARFNEVTSDSKLALDRQQALIDAAAGRPPAMGGSNDNAAPVVSAIDKMSSDLVAAIAGQVGGKLDAVNANLGLILAGGSGGGGGRGFEFRYANNF